MKKIKKCYNCGNTKILQEGNVAICKECGYQTSIEYKKDSDFIKKIKETSTRIVKENIIYDEDLKQYWVLSVIHVNKKGCIFPNDDKQWVFMKYMAIPVNERIKYPIPNKESEYYEFTIDPNSEQIFDKFIDAVNKLKEI